MPSGSLGSQIIPPEVPPPVAAIDEKCAFRDTVRNLPSAPSMSAARLNSVAVPLNRPRRVPTLMGAGLAAFEAKVLTTGATPIRIPLSTKMPVMFSSRRNSSGVLDDGAVPSPK